MVHDAVWAAAGMPTATPSGFLCVGCLERRLGRRLRPDDFSEFEVNKPCPFDTPRLAERKAPAHRRSTP